MKKKNFIDMVQHTGEVIIKDNKFCIELGGSGMTTEQKEEFKKQIVTIIDEL